MKILNVIGTIIGSVGLLLIFAIVFTLPVWLLWNWLMPDIFGLTKISLWQAWGLSVFANLLFGQTKNSND